MHHVDQIFLMTNESLSFLNTCGISSSTPVWYRFVGSQGLVPTSGQLAPEEDTSLYNFILQSIMVAQRGATLS